MAASITHEVNNPLVGVPVYTQLLSRKTADDNISKEITLDYLPKMVSDLTHSPRLIRNILDFARQSLPALREIDLKEVISCSISPENMLKLFTPFFTTKGKEKGVGLALAVDYGIIQRHRGKIEVQSKE